jgi:hypothetical protein
MNSFNPIYRKYIDSKNKTTPGQMARGKFYLIKEYEYVDGHKGKYSESNAPIIYTLFVSKNKNIVHAIKVSNVRPELIKKFFAKFTNDDHDELKIKGGSKKFYEKIVSSVPIISNDSYRTYKLSGLGSIISLDMDVEKLTPPKTKARTSIDAKKAIQNTEE